MTTRPSPHDEFVSRPRARRDAARRKPLPLVGPHQVPAVLGRRSSRSSSRPRSPTTRSCPVVRGHQHDAADRSGGCSS